MKVNVLEVDSLTIKTITGLTLVRNVSFSVKKNEVVALLGQSGSGKTMTSMAILDLLPNGVNKTSGDININEERLAAKMHTGAVSMIMQAPASCFDRVFTLKTQFIDVLKSHGKYSLCSDSHLHKMLNDVDLDNAAEILNAYSFQLSGGTLQRLMIALTLALETPLIIADEPTSDLDLPAQAEIVNLLKAIDKKERGILMITHDLDVAQRMADRVLVMHNGELVDNFAIGELDSNDRHSETKRLIRANRHLYDNAWHIHLGGSYA